MAKFIDLDTGLPALLNKVKAWVNSKLSAKQDTLTFDNAPTAGSNNPVKSGGIKTAIDNVMPTINENGKWVIGGVATDKDAQGPRGNTTLVNENAQGIQALIVNNVSDGGETDILSAEMGKVISQNIMLIFNALGTYAFPEGKPVLNWGSTVINHSINTNGVTGGLTISDVEIDGVSAASLPAQIADGKSLSFVLTPPSNKYVSKNSVQITMGGEDVTNDYYTAATNAINIPAVAGDIVIVAASVDFEAEIEYLQSSGTQWIDTGIVAATGFKCEIKADMPSADSNWHRLLAARDGNANFAIAVGIKALSSGGNLYSQFGIGSEDIIANSNAVVAGQHTFTVNLTNNALDLGVDGSVASDSYATVTLPNLSLYLFSNHREDSTVESISAKVYYCKIWSGSTLVRDFIPVRVGQVGQLYDKVSGELFANIGTGSFTLGNDK